MRVESDSGLTWTDLVNPDRIEVTKLAEEYSLHPLNLEDCISKRQIPKVDDHKDHVYILLQFPIFDERLRLVRESQVSAFVSNDYVVTMHEKELSSLGDLFRKCQEDKETRDAYMKSSTKLFYHVVDALVEDLFPLLKRIRGELGDIEDKVYDQRVSIASELSRQRRVIAALRRIVAELRRLFLDLTVDVQRFTKEDLTKYFNDVRDHIEKAWVILEEAKETIEIYKDADYVLSTELTNKVLAILTIIFTLTIPATVVGAIYGMNVPLPGGNQPGPLTFLGPFTSFYVLMLIAWVPAILMVLYFRNKGWL